VIGGAVADRTTWRRRAQSRAVLAFAPLGAAAVVTGAAFAAAAYSVSVLAVPAALILAALAVLSLSRPEIGVATAFVLLSLNSGLVAVKPWLPATAWIGFLLVASLTGKAVAGRRRPPLGAAALIFALLSLLGVVTSPDLGAAVPIVRSVVAGVALLYVIAREIRTEHQVRWVIAGMAGGAALIGGYATWQYLTGGATSVGFLTDTGEVVGRVTAGFGQPNTLAGFLVLLVPIGAAGALMERPGRARFAAATTLAVVGVYASFSRGALLALLVVPLVFVGRRRALLLAPFVVLALVVATPGIVRERFGTLTGQGPEVADRVDFWRTAGSLWADHPVLGVGIGRFGEAYAEARVPGKRFLPGTTFEPPPHAHNLGLNLLAEQGLVGFVGFAAVYGLAIRDSLRLQRSTQRWLGIMGSAILASLLAFGFHNLFDVTLREGTGTYFWGLLGLLSALTVIRLEEPLPVPAA
jgi:O-antigen ligase